MLNPHCVVKGGREEEKGDRGAGDVDVEGPGEKRVAEVHAW